MAKRKATPEEVIVDSTATITETTETEKTETADNKVRDEILGYLFKKYNVPEEMTTEAMEDAKNLYDSIASTVAKYAAEDDKEFIPEIIMSAADTGAAQFLRLYTKRTTSFNFKKTAEARISRINEKTKERLRKHEEKNKKFSSRLEARRKKSIERIKATMS